jgi:cation diffusion facilitator CzcD-associated flavoprotein CzcO
VASDGTLTESEYNRATLAERHRYPEYMNTSDIAVDHEVVVIGAGFSGIGAAIKLDQAGFHDFVVLEAGAGVGGAWHWNTYPGIAVDIP